MKKTHNNNNNDDDESEEKMEHRGTTSIAVDWQRTEDTKDGRRLIYGVAYTGAIKDRTRKTVKCSLDTWESDDDNVFYSDESVRWTDAELRKLDLHGLPMWVQHSDKLPAVGQVVWNHVNKDGDLCIVSEVPRTNKYQEAVIELIDSGVCADLSISYPLTRNDDTGVVSHGFPDEISFVSKGHFPRCRVGVKASKSPEHKVPPMRTSYRVVKARKAVPSQINKYLPPEKPQQQEEEEEMADNKNNNNGSSAADKDASTLNTELLAGIADAKRRAAEAEKEAASLRERAEKAEKLEKDRRDAEEKANKEYKDRQLPGAKEITSYLKQIAEEEGVQGLTPEWEEFNADLLAGNDPLGMQSQAVQVTCAEGFRSLKKRATALEAENKQLRAALKSGADMAAVEEGEDERHDRRSVKASLRDQQQKKKQQARADEGFMAPDADQDVNNVPSWALKLQSARRAGGYVRPTDAAFNHGHYNNQRSVKASARDEQEEDEVEEQQQQAEYDEEEEQKPAPARRSRKNVTAGAGSRVASKFVPTPFKPGFPVHANSMRNNPLMRKTWNFLRSRVADTDLNNAWSTHAGMELETPTHLK